MSLSSNSRLPFLRGPGGFHHAGFLEDLPAQTFRYLGVVLEENPGVLPPLSDPLAVHGVPRAAFLHNPQLDAQVQGVSLSRDPLSVAAVQLRFPKGGGGLVRLDRPAGA